MPKIDLHVHSYYSDGEDSPEDLKILMKQRGVSLFSITDHNCIHPEIKYLVEDDSLKFIQGIEVSSVDRITGQSLHILGYSDNFDIASLNNALLPIINGYNTRAKKIIEKLNNNFNCNFNFETIKNELLSTSISRNVLARRFVEFTGNKITIADAVKECFVQEDDLWMPDTKDAIKMISQHGGISVLAHPGNLFNKIDLPELVSRLVDSGLDGMEVYYAKHDSETIKNLSDIARRHNLLMTGGSDWHGKNFPRSGLGVEVPDIVYDMCISKLKIN